MNSKIIVNKLSKDELLSDDELKQLLVLMFDKLNNHDDELKILSDELNKISIIENNIVSDINEILAGVNIMNTDTNKSADHIKNVSINVKELANEVKEQAESIKNTDVAIKQYIKIRMENYTKQISLSGTEIFDIFISHASEDKDDFVRPLAKSLLAKKVKVFYDEVSIKWGDSLRKRIDDGLSKSKYGLVILSPSFFKKNWTQIELNGLFSRQMEGEKVILPIWHKITKDEVIKHSPILADMLAINTTLYSIDDIANNIVEILSTIQ